MDGGRGRNDARLEPNKVKSRPAVAQQLYKHLFVEMIF